MKIEDNRINRFLKNAAGMSIIANLKKTLKHYETNSEQSSDERKGQNFDRKV